MAEDPRKQMVTGEIVERMISDIESHLLVYRSLSSMVIQAAVRSGEEPTEDQKIMIGMQVGQIIGDAFILARVADMNIGSIDQMVAKADEAVTGFYQSYGVDNER